MRSLYRRGTRRLYSDGHRCFKKIIYVDTGKPVTEWHMLNKQIMEDNEKSVIDEDIVYFEEPGMFFGRKTFKI